MKPQIDMLRELQTQFMDGLFNPRLQSKIVQHIKANANRSAADQFAIYRGSVLGGLSKNLADTYQVSYKLVGGRFFDAMAVRFINKQGSYSPDLNDYGGELAPFIENFPPAASLPYLADVARLEWAWQAVYNSEDYLPGNLHSLHNISEEQQSNIIFHINPTARLLSSDYPVHQIWRTNQDDYSGDAAVDLDQGGIKLIIYRQASNIYMTPLEESQWSLLNLLSQNRIFADVCEKFSQSFAKIEIGAVLSIAIQMGWVTSYSLQQSRGAVY